MALILSSIKDNVFNKPRSLATWEGVATGDVQDTLTVAGLAAAAASVQITGTFGGATIVMQCSNDGTTWFTMKDAVGDNISATGNAYFEFSTSALYIRPSASGGTGDDLDVVLVMRG